MIMSANGNLRRSSRSGGGTSHRRGWYATSADVCLMWHIIHRLRLTAPRTRAAHVAVGSDTSSWHRRDLVYESFAEILWNERVDYVRCVLLCRYHRNSWLCDFCSSRCHMKKDAGSPYRRLVHSRWSVDVWLCVLPLQDARFTRICNLYVIYM